MPTTYGVLMKDNVNYSHDLTESISYDNSTSGLTGTNLYIVVNNIIPDGKKRLLPTGGTSTKYLRGDNTWQDFPDTTYAVMTSGTTGRVPTGGTNAKYLRGDATWQTPTNTTYGVVTTADNGLVPSGGTNAKYLRADGTWQTPINTTYGQCTTASAGLIYKMNSTVTATAHWATINPSAAYWNTAIFNTDHLLTQIAGPATSSTNTYRILYGSSSTATENTSFLKGYLYYRPSGGLLRLRDPNFSNKEFRIGTHQMYYRHDGTNYAAIQHNNGQQMTIKASAETFALIIAPHTYNGSASWVFAPNTDNVTRLGSPNYRWTAIYALTGSIQTSDRNEKKDIIDLGTQSRNFIMDLKPASFKYIEGESGRTHYGLIAQDVEETMNKFGMTAIDFAGFCKDQKMEEYFEDDDTEQVNPKQRPIEGEYIYSLRYIEFLAPMIKTIQFQKEDYDNIQSEIELIKSRLDKLENK